MADQGNTFSLQLTPTQYTACRDTLIKLGYLKTGATDGSINKDGVALSFTLSQQPNRIFEVKCTVTKKPFFVSYQAIQEHVESLIAQADHAA